MVKEYAERYYVPAIAQARRLVGKDLAAAEQLAAWKRRIRDAWPQVAIRDVAAKSPEEVRVGEPVVVEAIVDLGVLQPDDVVVELYHGPTEGAHELSRGSIVRMRAKRKVERGRFVFVGEIPTRESGSHAFATRVLPFNEVMTHPYEASLVRWA
jgi:starch phosphorylase